MRADWRRKRHVDRHSSVTVIFMLERANRLQEGRDRLMLMQGQERARHRSAWQPV
jgi:hypothetical protein